MSQGYVYIMADDTHSYLKIGMTTRTPEMRAKELNSTGMPGNLAVIDSIFVENCEEVEKALHNGLSRYRVKKNREFFDLPCDVACAYLKTFSVGVIEGKAFADLRDEIDALYEDGGIDSLLKALNIARKKLEETSELKHEFVKMVTDSGKNLYETFKDEPKIIVKDLGQQFSMNPIIFDPKDPAAWIIGLVNYQFTFDGSFVRDKWLEQFMEQGKKTIDLFSTAKRLGSEGIKEVTPLAVNRTEYEEILINFINDRKASIFKATVQTPLPNHPSPGGSILGRGESFLPESLLFKIDQSVENSIRLISSMHFDNTIPDYPFEPAERRNEIYHEFLDPIIEELNRFAQLSDWQKRKYLSRQEESAHNTGGLDNQKVVDLLDEIRAMERQYLMPIWDSTIAAIRSTDGIIKAQLAWREATELLLKYIRLMLFDASIV